jgi:hypothetical protein
MRSHIKVGSVVRRTLALYVGEVSVLLSVAVISVLLPMVIVAFVFVGPFGNLSAGGEPWPALILVLVAVALAVALFTGVVVDLVADVRDGRGEVSVRRRLRSIRPTVLGRLILVGAVAGLVIYVLLTLESLVITALIIATVFGPLFAVSITPVGVVLGVLASTMILLIPGLFLLTVWSVAAPVVVLEHPGGLRALHRSRDLVRGNGWRVFAAIAAVTISVNLVGRGIERAADYAFGLGAGLAAGVVIFFITLPIPVLLAGVLYFELREATTSDQPAGVTPPQAPTPPRDMPPRNPEHEGAVRQLVSIWSQPGSNRRPPACKGSRGILENEL